MTIQTKSLDQTFEVKALEEKGSFSAYGNTFNFKDHAGDVTVPGAFANCIKAYEEAGRMPRLLAQHGHTSMPIGIITMMKEDEHGLYFEGKFAPTPAGQEAYELVKMGAIDQFSIGYKTIDSDYDHKSDTTYLKELDVKEISLVTFACNEESLVQSIKSAIEKGDEVTPRMVQKALQHDTGLSKRQAEAAVNAIKAVKAEEETMETNEHIKAYFEAKNEQFPAQNLTDDHVSNMSVKSLNGLSFGKICNKICKAIAEKIGHGEFWVSEVYEGYAIFEKYNSYTWEFKMCKVDWSLEDQEVKVGEPVDLEYVLKEVETESSDEEMKEVETPTEDVKDDEVVEEVKEEVEEKSDEATSEDETEVKEAVEGEDVVDQQSEETSEQVEETEVKSAETISVDEMKNWFQ